MTPYYERDGVTLFCGDARAHHRETVERLNKALTEAENEE